MTPSQVSEDLNLTSLKDRESDEGHASLPQDDVCLTFWLRSPGDWQIFGASALTGTGLFEGVSLHKLHLSRRMLISHD